MLKCGIIGLPNVGKSTLFNALTSNMEAAESANYPFCTIEPNIAVVEVPDNKLQKLAQIAKSKEIINANIKFIDIAGLVKGASKGEGLGNKFLSHVREVDALLHVVRCFDNDKITHVNNHVNPIEDVEIVHTELILADLMTIEKMISNLQKKMKNKQEKGVKEEYDLLNECFDTLNNGKMINSLINEKNIEEIRKLPLLTNKPLLYVANNDAENISEDNNHTSLIKKYAKDDNSDAIAISSELEAEIAAISDENEKEEFLKMYDLKEPGLNKIIRSVYGILGLHSFYTVGEKEAHAWPLKKGSSAVEAAGVIHTDFMRGFIRAEVVACDDYLKYDGEVGAREHGRLRVEGKDYIVCDGDIMHFRFNV